MPKIPDEYRGGSKPKRKQLGRITQMRSDLDRAQLSFVCESCRAVHWYLPRDGKCRSCGRKDLIEI